MTRAQVHVIGCGNSLCGDDAVGIELVRELRSLRAEGSLSSRIRLTELGPGVSSWRRLLSPDERVVFADAATGFGLPGSVQLVPFSAKLLEAGGIEHGLHPLTQFALEQQLFGAELPTDAWLCLVSVPSSSAGPSRAPGVSLSPEAALGLTNCRNLLARLLERWIRP